MDEDRSEFGPDPRGMQQRAIERLEAMLYGSTSTWRASVTGISCVDSATAVSGPKSAALSRV